MTMTDRDSPEADIGDRPELGGPDPGPEFGRLFDE
jgi:hypothetical protein